jgi:hypothetical protein
MTLGTVLIGLTVVLAGGIAFREWRRGQAVTPHELEQLERLEELPADTSQTVAEVIDAVGDAGASD